MQSTIEFERRGKISFIKPEKTPVIPVRYGFKTVIKSHRKKHGAVSGKSR